jgi:hypothetical protein
MYNKQAQYKYHQSIKGKANRAKTERSPRGRYRAATYKAKTHRQEWSISREEYEKLIQQGCYYCEKSLHPTGIGLDRLNNDMGYSPTNVVPCCTGCNMLRGDRLTPEETKVAVRAILRYHTVGDSYNNVI